MQAQEEVVKDSSLCDNFTPHPMRVTMRHIEGNGVGYNQGYSTLEGFFTLPDSANKSWVPFLDLRGHMFNNGKPAANAGLGLRYVGSRVWGANAYYDYRKTNHVSYNQVGAGLETLGRLWDFRINGYLPVGTKAKYFDTEMEGFEGNFLILSRRREFDMKGGNAEVGVHITNNKYAALYAAVGPYYLDFEGTNTWGGEVRLALDVTDYLRFEGNTSYDSIFNYVAQGQLSVNIPFGGRKKVRSKQGSSCKNQGLIATRALQRVDRNEIIVVDKKTQRSKAIDPATGEPYAFIFVSNTSHSNGTFESPYNTLLAAQNASGSNDIIYVYPGDGTSTGMDAGITLQNGQKLWSSAFNHTLNTTLGSFTIAASTAALPTITNTTAMANVVRLANNNEISGFIIQNQNGGGDGITTGSNLATTNLTVTNNTILGDDSGGADGIKLVNLSGTTIIANNFITDQGNVIEITGVGLTGSSYTISNNTMTSSVSCLFFGLTDCANITTSVTGNIASTITSPALQYLQNNTVAAGGHTLHVTNNTFSTTNANIITSNIGFANLAATFSNNTITTTGLGTYGFNQSMTGSSILTQTLSNNTVNTTSDCFHMNVGDNANLTSTYATNTVNSSGGNGVFPILSGSSVANITVSNNTISGNTGGVRGLVTGAANHTTAITNNQIVAGPGSFGIQFPTQGDFSVSNVTISGNVINAPAGAVYSQAIAQASVTYSVTTNNATATAGTAMNFIGLQLTTSSISVENNTISSPAGFGLSFSNGSFGGTDISTGDFLAKGNTIGLCSQDPISIFSDGASVTTSRVLNNSFTQVPTALPYVQISTIDTSSQCLTFQGNVISPAPTISANDFHFTQANTGTFNLAPLSGNVGYIQTTGTITPVSSCP